MMRKALWKLGYRYRLNSRLPGRPDIVLAKYNVLVFIDGEFWHGFNWEDKKMRIKANRTYWISKIEKNILRDKRNRSHLADIGWKVISFWEHEIKRDIEGCVDKIKMICRESGPRKVL